jgi:iron complex outermembrane recepter protein
MAPMPWRESSTLNAALTQTYFPGFVHTTRESISYALTSNNHGQGACKFYNPFLTQFTNPKVANDPALMEWINQETLVRDKRNRLLVYDAVVTGELVELPGGMGQFAVGGQYRKDNRQSRASELNLPGLQSRILGYSSTGVPNRFHYVSNNYDCSMCAYNYDHDRVVSAVFGEMSLPFIENVETQIAVRWEDYGGSIGDEISPKLAMSWRPMDTLLLRTSWSQSFRAPNIPIIYEGLEASSTNFRDPIRNQSVRAGILPATNENAISNFTYTLGGPAPDVGNEYADTYNVGFIWTPEGALDGLSLGADVWRFEVSDRVLPQPPIDALQPEIDAFNLAKANPNNYVLNDSIPTNAAVPYVPCNPSALEAQFGLNSTQRRNCVVDPRAYQVVGIQRGANTNTGSLITLTLNAINAGTIVSDGVDFKTSYRWNNDWGRFSVSMDYTFVNQYKLSDIPGFERGLLDIYVFDAAGTTGDGNLVRSLPDNKGNITFNWQRDGHGVTLINRHIGSYKDLAYNATYTLGSDYTRSLLKKDIASYDSWDVQYRYRHAWGNTNLGSTIFTAGLLDAFNEELPYRESSGLHYDAGVFDGRGRRFYVRALWQFQ